MADAPYTNLNPRGESPAPGVDGDRATRTRLSEGLLDGRVPPAGDSFVAAAAPGDRSTFQADIAHRVQTMNATLDAASTGMARFNQAAQSGQLRPGTAEYNQAFKDATSGYTTAIRQASAQLFQVGQDGKLQPSQLAQQVDQQLNLVKQEAQALRAAAQSGQQLTPEQMQQLGVTSPDARQAYRQIVQQAMTLSDFQRSLGLAEANMGLALIRSTASLPEQSRQAQIDEGEKLISAAAGVDGTTLKDPNFWANYRYIYSKLGMQPPRQAPAGIDQPHQHGRPPVPGQPPVPGDGRDRLPVAPGAAPTTDQDTRFNLPYGTVRPDAQGFQDPASLLSDAEHKINGKLTPADIQRLSAAIQAADSLDRPYLKQQMDAEEAALKARVDGDQTGQLRLRVQAQRQLIDSVPGQDANIDTLTGAVAKTAGDGVVPMIAQMRQLQTNDALQQFISQESAAIGVIKQQPQGAQLLTAIQQRVAAGERMRALDGEIAQIDPQFASTWNQLNTNKRLYLSSIDTRAHALAALIPHLADDPNNVISARNLMIQMSQMDHSLAKRQDFLQTASRLGLTPDKLAAKPQPVVPGAPAALDVTQPQPLPHPQTDLLQATGLPADDSPNAIPPARAAALYKQVMQQVQQGHPITAEQEQAFDGIVQQAAAVNPQALDAEQKRLDALSLKLGNGTNVEARITQMQKDQSPTGQAALNSYVNQADIKDYLDTRRQYEAVVHGAKLAEGYYGLALLQGTTDPEKKRKAAALITDADTDQFAQQVLPLNQAINAINSTPQTVLRPGDVRPSAEAPAPAAPVTSQDQARYAAVPGLMNLERAAVALQQNQNNPQQALSTAQADLDQALADSAQIDPGAESAKVAALLPKLQALSGELAAMTPQQRDADTTRMKQFQDWQNQIGAATARAAEPTQVRLVYASALNHAAVALYTQAQGDPAHAADLQRQADDLNGKAISMLRQISQIDPNYGSADPGNRALAEHIVEGDIQLAQQKKAINAAQGAAITYSADAKTKLNLGLTFNGFTGLQPLTTLANMGGPLTSVVMPSPVSTVEAAATQDLVRAQLSDPASTDAAVAQHQQEQRDSWVHTAIDLVSGPGALYAAERFIPSLLSKAPLPAPIRLAAIGLGALGLDLGATFGLDKAAHTIIGSDELSTSELLAHSLASFGGSVAIRGAIGLRTSMAAGSLEQGATAKALAQLNPNLAKGINLTGTTDTEAARAYQAVRGLGAARTQAAATFDTAWSKEHWFFSPSRSTAVTAEMRAASQAPGTLPAIGQSISRRAFMSNELGVDAGNKLAYLKPSNIVAGFVQRTAPVGANGEFTTSVSDMAARQLWSKVGPAAATGGLATGLFGAGEVNPWVQNADGSQRYTWDESTHRFIVNASMGAIASGIAAPLIPAAGRFIGGVYKWPAHAVGMASRWAAPEASARFMKSAPISLVRNTWTAGTNKVAAGWEWLTAGSTDLGSITAADASARNFTNLYTRGYAQPLALPIAAAASSYWSIGEWDRINQRAKVVAQAIRDRQAQSAGATPSASVGTG